MSRPATISTSTPASDASTSTLFDALLKVIIGIGLLWKKHEDLVHEIKKLETRYIEGGASTDITSMVKNLLIHVDGFAPTLVELLVLCEELLELALTERMEADTAELARQKKLEKEQAEDYQTSKAQTERAEKHKRDFEAFCAEMDKNVNRFL